MDDRNLMVEIAQELIIQMVQDQWELTLSVSAHDLHLKSFM